MGKNIINIALFGLGRIGQMHANNLINHKDFNLKYIFDKDKKLSKKLSKKYNSIDIQNPKIAFKDKNIKCIFIASSTNTHLKFIEEAVVNKKVVFCEKPLDLDLNKINKCEKRISKYKPKIQLGFNRRYDPAHNSLNHNLLKGRIGKLEKIIITSRDPEPPPINYLKTSGGIFKDMMIHDFDLARYYMGSDKFRFLFATGEYFSEKKYKHVNDLESATVVMKSKKGVQCIITNSRYCSFGYDQRVELFGKKGMLLSGNQKTAATEIFNSNQSHSQKPFLNFFIERYKEAYNLQLNELISLHKNRTKPRSTFKDGYVALKIANAAYQSLKKKKVVKLK